VLKDDLETRLGYRFKNGNLLRAALTHRSYVHEAVRHPRESYERLEFLGDSLLGFIVSDLLVREDPDSSEGILTRRKQLVVRTAALAEAAREIGLGDALRLGRGEKASGGGSKPSLLADVFEAVIGAIYQDGGLRPTRAFVRRHLKSKLMAARAALVVEEDYKTRLQELVQARSRITPTYRIVSTEGPAHARRFGAEVRVGDRSLGSGEGGSRKEAEQAAARVAISSLIGEDG
jgi:ribonuclease-3